MHSATIGKTLLLVSMVLWAPASRAEDFGVLLDGIHSRLAAQADRAVEAIRQDPGRPRVVETVRPPSAPRLDAIAARYPFVAPALQAHGIPQELAAVILVESGGDPEALSPAGARGLWQFMPETARRYGLRVDASLDERVDPVRATRAAVRYLSDLYMMFQDWPLALAAYNAGEHRILQIIERTGIRDFWQMSRERLLPLETRRYVPSVLEQSGLLGQETVTP